MGGRAISDHILSLIQDTLAYLKENPDPVFASLEDADYFRKAVGSPSQRPQEKSEKAAPLPPPQAASPPVAAAKPPIPEPIATKVIPNTAAATGDAAPSDFRSSAGVQPTAASRIDFKSSSLVSLLSKIAPELPLIKEIPNDAIAKKINTRWKTKNQTCPISILSYQEPPAQKALLEEIAKALDICYGPARLVQAERIETEKQWEAFLSVADLKWVIVCDYTLWQLNSLMHFYKENPAQGSRTLGAASVFLLPDLSLYLKDPQLKRSLWKALCQKLST